MCTCDFREEGQKTNKQTNNNNNNKQKKTHHTNHCCSRFIKKKIEVTQPPFKIFGNVNPAMHNYEDIVK